MLVDRALFERLDGFDEAFPLDLGDTDSACAYVAWGGCSSPRTQRDPPRERHTGTGGRRLAAAQLFAARWGKRYAEGDPVEHRPPLSASP